MLFKHTSTVLGNKQRQNRSLFHGFAFTARLYHGVNDHTLAMPIRARSVLSTTIISASVLL